MTPDEVGATLAAFAQALVAALMPGPEGAAALERLASELHEIATEAPVDSDERLKPIADALAATYAIASEA